jgi:DNA-binding transcriptional LysR family regulator
MNYYERYIPLARTMDLTDLEVFLSVIENGGVTKAAERLHRVPSNVTTRVRKFEEELGVPLFLREGKRMRLSPAGEMLRGYAERILALVREAREAVVDDLDNGLLRLGSMESAAAVRLPKPLSEFHRRYPNVTLELQSGSTRQLMAKVLAGELDAALVADAIPDSRLGKHVAYREELVIVAEAGHQPIKSPKDVSRLTVLAFGAGCAYRKRLETWFDEGALQPDRIMEFSSYHAILGCAVAGMGIALIPRSILDVFPGRAQLSAHPLSRNHAYSETAWVWRKDSYPKKLDAIIRLNTSKTKSRKS